MLLDKMVYFDGAFIFLAFLCIMSSVKDKNKIHLRNHLIGVGLLYVIYLILDVIILPELLYLSLGYEIILCGVFVLIQIAIFIILSKPPKKIGNIDDSLKDRKISKKERNILIALIIIPIVLFCVPLFREMYFINNSKVVLVFQEGSGFDIRSYGYAMNNNYCEKISVGTASGGLYMHKCLPSGFNTLNPDEEENRVNIKKKHIIVYGINKEVICEGEIDKGGSVGSLKRVLYR